MTSRPTVKIFPETWATRVGEFVTRAGTEEEARAGGGPEVIYCRIGPVGMQSHYTDYNVRSRHFRCVETFFVEVDAGGELRSVVAVDGLLFGRPTLSVTLIVTRARDGEDQAAHLRGLLEAVLAEARRYADVRRLRLSYLYSHSFSAPLESQVSRLIVDAPERLGLVEEARIANETGAGREAVLLVLASAAEQGVAA